MHLLLLLIVVSSVDLSIALVAGESSGDLLAGKLLSSLRKYLPTTHLYGIGGPCMIKEGLISYWSIDKLTVRGLFEIIPHYFIIKNIQNSLRNQLLKKPPEIFIGVDYPGFNLGLELQLRKFGIPTMHFISPQIWAWRGWRIQKIMRAVSHMLVIFPFEAEIYRKVGIPVTYVGHPLAQMIPIEPNQAIARMNLNLSQNKTIIAILPGSRLSELKYNTDSFLGAAKLLAQRESKIQFIVPMVGIIQKNYFLQLLKKHIDIDLQVICCQSHTVLAAADGVLVASGTASLEAALFKKPMVIAYKMMHASYMIMRHMNYQPWIGLPNILAREFIIPEFIQNAATPKALADALWQQLDSLQHCHRLYQRFTEMHHLLLRDTAALSATTICDFLKKSRNYHT